MYLKVGLWGILKLTGTGGVALWSDGVWLQKELETLSPCDVLHYGLSLHW